MMERIRLAKVPVDAVDMHRALSIVDDFIRSGTPHYNVAINAAKVVGYQEDPLLRDAIEQAHLLTADGQAVVWASRLLGRPLPERVAGVDLMLALLQYASHSGHSVFFLGGTQDVVEACVNRARSLYPQLKVAGYRNGYFSTEDESVIVADVASTRPDILFLGFGTPTKEYFMLRHHEALGVPFVMGVGGSFDVFAGVVSRAPIWMQRFGLEWAFRVAQEPRRMWRRYLYGNTRFMSLVLRALLSPRQGL